MKTLSVSILLLLLTLSSFSKTLVYSLEELVEAVKGSNQKIYLKPGKYNFEDLPSKSRNIIISGSNNQISLKGVYVKVPVGCVGRCYINVTGDNNTIYAGEFEDTYRNGLTEVTDFSAYNKDRKLTAMAVSTESGQIINTASINAVVSSS